MASLDLGTMIVDQFRSMLDAIPGGRVAAGNLRAMGVGVDEAIPDCATISTDALILKTGKPTTDQDIEAITIAISVGVDDSFSWFEVHLVADKTTNPGEDDGKP